MPRSDDAAEGDGWVLSVVYRGDEGRSDLAVFEATDIAKGPVALAHLSSQVPAGFHGNWRPGPYVCSGDDMITVHHLENSRSQRMLWMLEELGLDYEVKLYKREPSMQAPASLRAVHPLGKSPVITDGDKTLAESGAILEYLVETYGNGRFAPPAGTPERLHYTYFLHYAEGSLMPLLFMKLVFSRLPERVPWFMRPVARAISNGADKTLLGPQITNHFAFLESELAQARVVRRRRVHGRRHPDELPARGRRRARSASPGSCPSSRPSSTASRRGRPTSARSKRAGRRPA